MRNETISDVLGYDLSSCKTDADFRKAARDLVRLRPELAGNHGQS